MQYSLFGLKEPIVSLEVQTSALLNWKIAKNQLKGKWLGATVACEAISVPAHEQAEGYDENSGREQRCALRLYNYLAL